MTRFRDELRLLADQAPDVDLAERAVRGARRWKATAFGSVAASLIALALTAAVLTGGSGGGGAATTTEITDVLPASGVDPAAYAYYDFCGRQWDPRKNTHTFAGRECAQWRLVTQGGQSFRMPQALSVYTEQSPDEYMNTGGPLVISSDGRRVAYYSEKDQKFAVRDLADGRIWLTPQTITRETMVKSDGLLRLSPDGRFLSLNGHGQPDAVVDIETGQVTEIPANWWVQRVGNGGKPIIVENGKNRLGVLDGGRVVPLTPVDDAVRTFSEPSSDGRTLAYFNGAVFKDHIGVRDDDTIVTVDVTTGDIRSRVKFTDVPKGFRASRMGGWLNTTEVVITGRVDGDPTYRWKDGVPTLGETTYAIDVNTGRIRKLDDYTYRAHAGNLALPGF